MAAKYVGIGWRMSGKQTYQFDGFIARFPNSEQWTSAVKPWNTNKMIYDQQKLMTSKGYS